MFGKIIGFDTKTMYVENAKGIPDTNYIGYHVIFDETDHKIVGEIIRLDSKKIDILLIGEIANGRFSNGVLKKPSINTICRIIYKSELESILGSQDYLNKSNILFGSSPIYNDYLITCPLNEFFANHFAIIGNTGSGKSCGLARLIQNVFFTNNNGLPNNAHMVLFDVYGEYYETFNEMNNIGLNFKKYSTKTEFGSDALLNIPAYFLDSDDLAILLSVNDPNQVPILKKSLDLVRIFKSLDPKAEDYKNDIIARCVLDILSSGKKPSQVRDQVISLLSSYNTKTLNLTSTISQPGYDRTLRQCLNIDDQGKINAVNLVIEHLQKYLKVDLDVASLNKDVVYSLSDLYNALEFALISEGAYTSNEVFDHNNVLKSRLQTIINSKNNDFFKADDLISKGEFVQRFFTSSNGQTSQLVDVNLSFLDDKFAKAVTKIFTKLFFEFTTTLETRGSFAIHIILEEAHRYVQNDTDLDVLGYNIFDRITKEGRKYGTILGFITQRPNELSKTALSQCSNFVVFRLFYPEDLEIVKGISSNVTEETVEKIKTLHPGTGLVFGSAFKIPLLVNFPLPNPLPVSTSLKVDDLWFK